MDYSILILIGLGNLIISIISFYVLSRKKDKSKGLLLLFFMLICPVIGPSFLFISWSLGLLFSKKDIDIADLSFNTENINITHGVDFEKEINIVPVEEALLVSDIEEKRRVILDVLKEDYKNSYMVISSALENDDSEISHYAATIIADVKANFKDTTQKKLLKLEQFPNDQKKTYLLVNYILSFLEKKVLSRIEELTYIEQCVQLMNNLYIHHRETITGKMYRDVISHLLNSGKKDEAFIWGERAMADGPEELDVYKGVLKLYFECGERNKFFEVIKKLKESDILFDKESLELIRYYQV